MKGAVHAAVDARVLAEPPGGIRRWLEGILSGAAGVPRIRWTLLVPSVDVKRPPALDAALEVVAGSTTTLLRPWWEVGRLPGALRRIGADVLLSPYGIVPPRCPVPVVSIVHDLAFLKWPVILPWRYRIYWRWVARSVPRAATVVTLAQATASEVVVRLGVAADRIRVVHCAAAETFAPRPVGDAGEVLDRLGVNPPFVLAVGTLEPRKNLGVLITALDRVNADRPKPVVLVLAGRAGWGPTPPLRPWIVRIEGACDEDLAALYSAAAVFAMPSVDEGFGLPAVEAMACGAPVIVADAGSLPEVVDGAGWVLAPDDVAAWAVAISELIDDPSSADDFRQRSLERAKAFSWRAAGEGIAAILRNPMSPVAGSGSDGGGRPVPAVPR